MENIDTTFLAVNEEFKSLQLNKQVDFDKFNFYATTAHSTAIEGSTLSVNDTTLLLDNKMPIQGKSMLEMDMVRDHYQALLYAKANAENKLSISIQFIQELNRRLMKNSGSIINTALGSTDTSNGDIRKFAVLSGSGGYYLNHEKVPDALRKLVSEGNKLLTEAKTPIEIHNLAFDFHYNLVTIHPFGDGNGRVSRLMMNYIQWFHNEPITIINSKMKNEYILAIVKTRESGDFTYIRSFLKEQHCDYLSKEMDAFKTIQGKPTDKQNRNNDFGMSMVFV